jgi:hypothetical protein
MLVTAFPGGLDYGVVWDLLEYGAGFSGEAVEFLAVGLLRLACEGVADDLLDVGSAPAEPLHEVAWGVDLDGLGHGVRRYLVCGGAYSVGVSWRAPLRQG